MRRGPKIAPAPDLRLFPHIDDEIVIGSATVRVVVVVVVIVIAREQTKTRMSSFSVFFWLRIPEKEDDSSLVVVDDDDDAIIPPQSIRVVASRVAPTRRRAHRWLRMIHPLHALLTTHRRRLLLRRFPCCLELLAPHDTMVVSVLLSQHASIGFSKPCPSD